VLPGESRTGMRGNINGRNTLRPASSASGTAPVFSSNNRPSSHPLSEGAITADGCSEPPLKVSIIMCAFNEQRTITQAIREVLMETYPCEIELIVVDDGSADGTGALASQVSDPRLIIHRHDKNQGKGFALLTAVELATGTHVLPFDADLEYSAEDIPRLIEPVIKRGYDVVYGARLFGFNTVYQSYRYALGNRCLTQLTNVLFDASISDLHTCLKLVPLGLFKSLALRQRGFGLDTELTASLLRLGIRPFEIPISYYSRSRIHGKKINWRDAFACVAVLFQVRFRRRKRLFASASEDQVNSSESSAHVPSPLPKHNVSSASNSDDQTDEEASAVATG
jgi:dolichol-phosphate hexosyltransferase